MINTQVLKGNLIRQDYTTAFVLNQGDKGVPFKIELLENGAPYILQSTDIVTIEWLKPNGSPFLQDTGITKGDTYVEITTPEAISQSSGSGTFNIIISDGTTRKGTIKREYKVVSTSLRPGSVSEGVITDAITELRNLNTKLAETVQNNQEIIKNNQAATKQDISNINSSLEENKKYINDENTININNFKDLLETDYTKAFERAIEFIKNNVKTNGLNSEDVKEKTYTLLIPFGNFVYNGQGLDLSNVPTFKIKGYGYSSSRIEVSQDVFLFNFNTPITRIECDGIKFSGGKGYFNLPFTNGNIRTGININNCYFYGYSVCAIGSNSSDYPYWTIEDNVFFGTSTSIGVVLPRGNDCSSISKNKFLYNKFHIKCNSGHGEKIINNDFIRFDNSVPMTDIWIVPRAISSGGGDLRIQNNKFGNENLRTNAIRILIADEDTSSGTDVINRNNYLTTQSNGVISGLELSGNSFSGGNYNSIITSYTLKFRDNYISNYLYGTYPKYIIEFPNLSITDLDENYNRNNIFDIKTSSEPTTQKYPLLSNLKGIGNIIDYNNLMLGDENLYNNTNISQDNNVNYLLPHSKKFRHVNSLGESSFSFINDSLGDLNGINIKGYGCSFTNENPTKSMPLWLEFDAKKSSENPTDLIKVVFYISSKSVLTKFIRLTNEWRRIRIPFYNRIEGNSIRVEIQNPNNSISTMTNFSLGRLAFYQSYSPISYMADYNVHSLRLELNTVPKPNQGMIQLYCDSTSDLKVMLPDGTIKKLQLID